MRHPKALLRFSDQPVDMKRGLSVRSRRDIDPRGPGRIRVNATVLRLDALTAADHRRWLEASA